MDKRLNAKYQQYSTTFKNNIRDIILKEFNNHPECQSSAEHVIQQIFDYTAFEITKDDLTKRKRVKNIVPQCDRCCAKRANGEQCSRRCLESGTFCGTHIKGTPHGVIVINAAVVANATEKVCVFIQEIKGIYYYLDNVGNVYKPEDVLGNRVNPDIIAQYVKTGDIYSIQV